MLKLATRFAKDESGAVTVDWVVLTAAIVGLNIAVLIGYMTDSLELNAAVIADKTAAAIDQ